MYQMYIYALKANGRGKRDEMHVPHCQVEDETSPIAV